VPYYVFSVGGTGARCLESLIYLCAMGIYLDQPLFPIFVDPDQSNGNITRTLSLIQKYKLIREHLPRPSKDYLFNTEIIYCDEESVPDTRVIIPNLYNPNSGLDPSQNKLSHFIEYETKLHGTEYKFLADLLFSKEELNMDMSAGYRGIPSIGSILMTDIQNQAFWTELRGRLEEDTASRVFIFASLFGGTGASGYPVISKLIKNASPTTKVGGVLMLPYFKLKDPENLQKYQESLKKEKIMPNSKSFMINAKTACEFYKNNYSQIDSNYFLGDDFEHCKQYENYAIGSAEQKNDAHMLELMAAYAAIDFFHRESGNFKPFYVIQVKNPDKNADITDVVAEDIPHQDKEKPFERFALLYHYINELFELIDKDNAKLLDKIAWLRDLKIDDKKVRARDIIDKKTELSSLKELMDSFQEWIYQNHNNYAKLNILDYELKLDNLLTNNPNKYKGYHISHLDTKFYGKKTNQNDLLGDMLEAMSLAKITEGR